MKLKNLFLFLVIAAFFYLLWQLYLPADFNFEGTVAYTVERGMNNKTIANDLQQKGIIKNSWPFMFYVIATGQQLELKAGTYEISPSMPVITIAKKIINGDVKRNVVKIIEGQTVNNIAENLQEQGIYQKGDFLSSLNKNWTGQFEFLKSKPTNMSLEGYIFPDTYELPFDKNPDFLVEKALSNFESKITEGLRAEIKKQGKTIHQVITMASILEKEVKTLEDKKLVADVLEKRLANGMPLQVDATVNYITGKSSPRVSLADITIDSPYNTYRYAGLPPGPISNPGLDSILAAIYPTQNPYWYYITSLETGETIFSRTSFEHDEAVNNHLNGR